MPKETYIQLVSREFSRMEALANAAMAQLTAEQFFAAPGDGDNCIAVIVKHVGGNLSSRWTDFLTSDGEKPGRNRDGEFSIVEGETREGLMERWNSGWRAVQTALGPLADSDVERTVTIRGEPLSVLQAINRQLTHNSYHIGQIVYVAKHLAGASWKSLSIARGQSADFNAKPVKYVGPG